MAWPCLKTRARCKGKGLRNGKAPPTTGGGRWPPRCTTWSFPGVAMQYMRKQQWCSYYAHATSCPMLAAALLFAVGTMALRSRAQSWAQCKRAGDATTRGKGTSGELHGAPPCSGPAGCIERVTCVAMGRIRAFGLLPSPPCQSVAAENYAEMSVYAFLTPLPHGICNFGVSALGL